MKTRVAKFLIRTLGTIVGLIGISILCCTPIVVIGMFKEDGNVGLSWAAGVFFVALFPGTIGTYLSYVGYSIWHRFSPLAVGRVCFFSVFIALSFCFWLMHRGKHPGRALNAIEILICMGGAYVVARLVGERLIKLLFPEQDDGAHP